VVSGADLESVKSDASVAEATDAVKSCRPFASKDGSPFSETRVKVYLPNDGPDKTTEHEEISVEDYKREELHDIDELKEIIKSVCTELTIDQLKRMGVVEEGCKELAQIVMDGGEVKFKTVVMIGQEDKECVKKADSNYDEDIKKYHRISEETKSYQCLLISAPLICKQVDSLEQQEMMNFCRQAFPPNLFDAAAVEELKICHEVSRPEEVRKLIGGFFRRRDGITAKRALHALLVFFGHGGPGGFHIGKKDLPLNDIISIVKEKWLKALKRDPECLPVRVKIIFAHCYSHVYDQETVIDKVEVDVVALTNKGNPLAYAVKNAEGTYYNMQLKKYVDEHLGPEIRQLEAGCRKARRIKKTKPDSGFVPDVKQTDKKCKVM